MCGSTLGRLRESRPRGSLTHILGAFVLGFPLTAHLALPGSRSIFGIFRVLPRVCAHLLAKMGSSEEA